MLLCIFFKKNIVKVGKLFDFTVGLLGYRLLQKHFKSRLDSFCKILYGESESLFTTVWHVGLWSTHFFLNKK